MPADEFTLKLSTLMGFFVVLSLFISWYFRRDTMLDAIPTVGFSDPILSYLSAVQFNFDGVRMLKDGYEKTRPGLFKIANFRRWMVLVSGPELIEDVKRAPDDVLSGIEAELEVFQGEYTLDILDLNDLFHTDVIRSKLTRNIAVAFKENREELIMTMDDVISMRGDGEAEWVTVPIQKTVERVICRTTNRIFVGVPLCRDYDYLTLNLTFGESVFKSAMILNLFPKPLKPIVFRMISNVPSQIQQEIEFIRPMVEERFAKMEQYGGDWDDKPGVERSVEGLARRLLTINIAATSLTSLTLTQALYRLLANPKYIEPLRQEVDAVIKEEGWTKAGMDKMYKIDSFIRETLRVDGFTILPFIRLALRPFTFSNGVAVPAGTFVAIPASAAHTDERIYPNANEFDGFRFSKLRETESVPGRFFAVNELKTLFAHIVATYDVKFEEGKGIPREVCFGRLRLPGKANVMFRTRQK
ncbi:cytochrome P450 [Russula ochroleuca]|uniref:Cytochrome P450 n=1 Tax=Russula ochroleuca TaxID=152965 RepID=A0A9P5JYI6_9AGAM|nr:cytochrome P450 [Russula ochroleuca]